MHYNAGMHTDFQCPACQSIALNHSVELCIEDAVLADLWEGPAAPEYREVDFEAQDELARDDLAGRL